MNDTEKKQLYSAVSILVNMEGQLTNMTGRSGRAVKFWTDSVKASKTLDDKQRATMKRVITGVTQLTSDAKTVLKDLNALGKDTGNAKLLAAAPTGKAFRDKVVAQRIASSRKFEANAAKVVNDLMSVLGGNMWIGMKEVDPKVTVDSLKGFSSYFNEMRIELAKL